MISLSNLFQIDWSVGSPYLIVVTYVLNHFPLIAHIAANESYYLGDFPDLIASMKMSTEDGNSHEILRSTSTFPKVIPLFMLSKCVPQTPPPPMCLKSYSFKDCYKLCL